MVKLALEYDVDISFLGKFGKPVGRFLPSEPEGPCRRQAGTAGNRDFSGKIIQLFKNVHKGKVRESNSPDVSLGGEV